MQNGATQRQFLGLSEIAVTHCQLFKRRSIASFGGTSFLAVVAISSLSFPASGLLTFVMLLNEKEKEIPSRQKFPLTDFDRNCCRHSFNVFFFESCDQVFSFPVFSSETRPKSHTLDV